MSVRILHGDCRDVLPTLEAGSVQCCVTSPPYYGLRDYQVAGQIGLEPTPDEYVAQMVAVFREVRRALRDDGTLFLNLGDSYAATTGSSGASMKSTLATKPTAAKTTAQREVGTWRRGIGDAKPKDLLGIPWLVAFALRADGWYLRSDIIWHKPNPMPESVTDRPTSAHEHVFLLTKSARYFWDADAVAEPATYEVISPGKLGKQGGCDRQNAPAEGDAVSHTRKATSAITRNLRNVWTIATQPYSGAHFATMPPELAERCIKAGTSERGCCPHCGAPWGRVVERSGEQTTRATAQHYTGNAYKTPQSAPRGPKSDFGQTQALTTGWSPTCSCPEHQPVPCVVLDPFGGAGTTALMADRLNRHATIIELNPQYRDLARERITEDAGMFAEVMV